MPLKLSLWALLILGLLAAALPTEAQRHGKANLNEDVPLPADFAIDYQLGISERGRIRGASSLLEDTEYNEAGTAVFSKFVRDPSVASLGLPYQWNFTIVNDGSVNAYSLPDGEVSVGSGLAKLIGTKPGLWAAVLSHETAHVARRHWVRKYLYDLYVAAQISYYQARVRAGDNNANWSLVGLRIAAPIARAKLSRGLEHDADIQGMMLMAREGYHPDSSLPCTIFSEPTLVTNPTLPHSFLLIRVGRPGISAMIAPMRTRSEHTITYGPIPAPRLAGNRLLLPSQGSPALKKTSNPKPLI